VTDYTSSWSSLRYWWTLRKNTGLWCVC